MDLLFYEKTKDGELFNNTKARLLKERIIFLDKEIEGEDASMVVAHLFLLDQENKEEPITIWLNSPGGDIRDFFAIYDMMNIIQAPIKTICFGSASSAAAILLCAGSPGMRYITPNSHVMIHQLWTDGIGGTGTEVEIEAKELKRLKNRLAEIIARHSGQPVARVSRDCEHDKYMDAETAKEYGIIDQILEPTKEIPQLKKAAKKTTKDSSVDSSANS